MREAAAKKAGRTKGAPTAGAPPAAPPTAASAPGDALAAGAVARSADPWFDQLLLAWRTNARVNARLLDAIPDDGLADTLSTRGGRDVVRQFAHLHNVRVWHLQERVKALAQGLRVFETQERPSRKQLLAALEASGLAIEALLVGMVTGTPRVRGFQRGPVQMLAYFVAHEAHHRGNILLTLKQCGHAVEQRERYALWDWDRL